MEQAPNIEPGRGRLVYDKARRTIVAEETRAVQQFLDDMAECISTLPITPSKIELVKAAFRTSISYAKAKAINRDGRK